MRKPEYKVVSRQPAYIEREYIIQATSEDEALEIFYETTSDYADEEATFISGNESVESVELISDLDDEDEDF